MSNSKPSLETLKQIVYHVFLPPKLPQHALDEELERSLDAELCHLIIGALAVYRRQEGTESSEWASIDKMLKNLSQTVSMPLEKNLLAQQMAQMRAGDILALRVRAQNAAILIRKQASSTVFEVFEVQPSTADVMSTSGKLVRPFPGPAVELSNKTAESGHFLKEISNFLSQMDSDILDESAAMTKKAALEVLEVRDSAHPHYISELFLGILRGLGKDIQPRRIVKRVADEVLWHDAYKPWRRSPLWLVIRVAIQTSLTSKANYKHFMLFFETRVLRYCLKHDSFPSELLFTMRVKMSRRFRKVEDSAPEFIGVILEDIFNQAEKVLQDRWSKVQSIQAQSPVWNPEDFDLEKSIIQSLPNSRAYLDKVLNRRLHRAPPSPFHPHPRIRLQSIKSFGSFIPSALSSSFEKTGSCALFDFEASVRCHLLNWTNENLNNTSACDIIASCLAQYITAAQIQYVPDAVDQSMMVLTILELWVALDKLATSQCPLLLDYSPEIPESFLEPLLIRSTKDIDRANEIQRYLRRRHFVAQTCARGSVFSNKISSNSLPVRYFRQSRPHQELKQAIVRDANAKREQKVKEMTRMNENHNRIVEQAKPLTCIASRAGLGKGQHRKMCEKCQLTRQAAKLKIQVHEWPLPNDSIAAEMLVFELKCPKPFQIWRDVTYTILCDLGRAERVGQASPFCLLSGYDGLATWSATLKAAAPRIVMGSTTKSFLQAHYASVKAPTTQDKVCVNLALNFELYDGKNQVWASGPFTGVTASSYGTFSLPPNSSYLHLGYALQGTEHTSNQVIVDQHACPTDLSLHEHIAFGTLRAGPYLQWMNILRGLEENCLTFSHEEVNILHGQAAWQIGPLSTDGQVREWHLDLADANYGRLLIAQSLDMVRRVKANWLESASVRTAVLLVARLLSSTLDSVVVQSAHSFLREARAVALKWLNELSKKLQGATADSQILDYQRRVCEMAMICRSTYDVDLEHTIQILSNSDDISTFVTCSIILRDNLPPELDKTSSTLQMLVARDRRLAHNNVLMLLEKVQQTREVLNSSIGALWPGYRAGSTGWVELPSPNSCWVTTNTAATPDGISQRVHLDLLEGLLLIDGNPLGRLPQEYVNHPVYTRLFGQTVLDVVPANLEGMIFSTRTPIHGHQVSFALDPATNDLIIQAQSDGETFELIPQSRLAKDFPLAFSSDYHHWLNTKSRTVEFRPLLTPWLPDMKNWRILLSGSGNTWMVSYAKPSSLYLLDFHGHTFESIARIISPLETSHYLLATHSSSGGTVIELPRMRLSFFINSQMQLESNNLRGQIIDQNQSSGTMFGLRNQLLLCAKDPAVLKLPQSRTVLIPHGEVAFKAIADHVVVTIDSGSDRQVTFHQLKIDSDLRYLAATAGLTTRLFKIYLHAITSHCLPDPLTGRTGTEEALQELSGAAVSSFEQIDETQARLLSLIDSLTPARSYYPPHLQCMQTTHWVGLPTLSQHYAFHSLSQTILDRADTLQLFHPLSFDLASYMRVMEPNLLERNACRTWFYYPENSVPHPPIMAKATGRDDQSYIGRDSTPSEWVMKGDAARWAAGLAYQRWLIPTFTPCALVSAAESWGEIEGPSNDLSMTYSPGWLRVDVAASWIAIFNLCRKSRLVGNRYGLVTCLASAIYGGGISADLLRALVAVASSDRFTSLAPPLHPSYHMTDEYQPKADRIRPIVSKLARNIDDSPAKDLPQNGGESSSKYAIRRRNHYDNTVLALTTQFTQDLAKRWPSLQLRPADQKYYPWFNVEKCLEKVEKYFSSCTKNLELRTHLKTVEEELSSQPVTASLEFPTSTPARASPDPCDRVPTRRLNPIELPGLMGARTCPGSANFILRGALVVKRQEDVVPNTSHLAELLAEFGANADQPLRKRYGEDLEKSRQDLLLGAAPLLAGQLPPYRILDRNRNRCLEELSDILANINGSLEPQTRAERVAFVAGTWPRITPRTLFGILSLHTRATTKSNWLEELVVFAQAFINYQRSQRLIGLALEEKREEFFKELEFDIGVTAPENYDPDWLLIQIDSNFSVRSVQSKVAAEMISPASADNTVLQLNMGEGKSSVIVPIISATLANSKRLVRVVVLKPLWRQMFQLLVSRLSGLANRRVYYLPFGRHIHVDQPQAQKLQKLYDECMREGGILLVQPEHILSFKLMGVDRLISSTTSEEIAVSRDLQNMQDWLTNYSRDILDESDEILHVRYQLVYTVGEQQSLENHPDRWTTTQQILMLICHHIGRLQKQFPDSLQYVVRSRGEFPFIRIMPDSSKAVEHLNRSLAMDVLEGRIPNMNLVRLPSGMREKVLQLLTDKHLPEEAFQLLKNECDPSTWKGLLLLRGLIACGILVFALREKHYRVDFGLCLNRSLLAVPFHAKDTPSLRAEFGHPDVAVVLTCLSYYYQGLTNVQLEKCFELLYKLDNPALEYDQWIYKNNSIPLEFRRLNSVNVEDHEQFKHILVPAFARNVAVINFFLSAVAFPKQAKQFPHKLVTSGWDLAETKSHVTTGFSGTNDNQYLLPTSMAQADPLGQSSTNALVLTCLLQLENNYYLCSRRDDGTACSAPELLKLLVNQTPEIRVLLDVGAQMLELQNVELARSWLELRPDVSAAVFFSDADDLMVLPQNGSPIPLLSSPFAQHLEKCVVYLDDGHTRGTDLKLPRHTRAAVTLGSKVTKDRLLQGCMRMRKLGHGHSVMFCAPPEIDRQIQKSRPSESERPVQVLDILRWAMLETCQDLAHHVSHWAQQGVQYSRRVEAQCRYTRTNDITTLREEWTMPESYPLDGMYGVSSSDVTRSSGVNQAARSIPSLNARLQLLGVDELGDPSMNEEQEREVSHEVERERQIERPLKSLPAPHMAHADVQTFIRTGEIPKGSKAFLSLFHPLQSYDSKGSATWSAMLLASVDYTTTISGSSISSLSDYMRPVNWVVSGSGGTLVVLSPYEVNKFISSIRNSAKVRLHIYAPRVTRTMKSFSALGSYSLPALPTRNWAPPSPSIQMQLNLWAGQLYLKDFDEYLLLCSFLGIYNLIDGNRGTENVKVQIDGFVQPADRLILAKYRPEINQNLKIIA
ncbi:hypothetical protein BDV93DRAFT_596776 [Ceratobasidium sp. AG-I]|nr:hypothetical protein BDV93DRAFT_596776 [Ceratobasidium sp. AG-I]